MRRREFIAGLAGAVAWPVVARAQQADRVRHVGALMNGDPGDAVGQGDLTAFRQGLMELGWIEGRNIDIELRWPGGDARPDLCKGAGRAAARHHHPGHAAGDG